jgi:hypothetical protein
VTAKLENLQTSVVDDYGAIGTFLRSPTEFVDLDSFCERFHARRIFIRLAGLAPAAIEPALAGRLRGAFGEVLMETTSREAAAGRPCPWSPPSAYEPLFRKQGRMTPGTDFPSPWVIAVRPRRTDLYVSLTLFGIACEWAAVAAETLVQVVARRIDWRAAARVFVPEIAIVERWMEHVTLDTGMVGGPWILNFSLHWWFRPETLRRIRSPPSRPLACGWKVSPVGMG